MKIAVCIKRVPDSETRVRVASDGKSLEEAGVKFVVNPYDEFAIEEALRRKEQAGGGEVVIVSLGPAAAQETIRTALAMGADRGVLLQVDRIAADGWTVATALTAELKDGGYDLILFGKTAIDDCHHQTGPMVAELLGLPCVTSVGRLDLAPGKGTAEREIEGAIEVCEFPLPAVLTVDKGLNEPRYPALKGIMAAKKKPLDIKPTGLAVGAMGIEVLALTLPAERQAGRIVGEGAAAVPELVRLLREEAKVLVSAILAVLEQRDGTLRKVSHEVVTAARRLADARGDTVDALVLAVGVAAGSDQLGRFGADRVVTAAHAAFQRYAPEAAARVVADRVRAERHEVVLFAASAAGMDLAPRVAAKLAVPLVADVTDLRIESGALLAVRPTYAGKALLTVKVVARPAVVSLRPNVFTPVERPRTAGAQTVSVELPEGAGRVVVREVKAGAAGALDVAEAVVVISGGRGLKEPGNFKLLEELARAFGGGAAVGASRAVVDAGWRPHADQVGQTGKTVSPPLYIAVGISGAVQHLAGMRTSKVIVAINKDKDAPIFKVADFGVVGDLFEVIPKLTEEIRKLHG